MTDYTGERGMLSDDDLDEVARLIEQRKRFLARIDGIAQQFTHTSQHAKSRELLQLVEKCEEQLREYGLMIDTVGSTN